MQTASALPQRGHRVDAGCAARGEITCKGGDGCQQNEHSHKSEWVSGTNAEQEATDCSSESPGRGDPDENANGGERERLKKDTGLEFLRGSAEGHANADFLRALADRIGDDGVDAERGQDEGEGCETCEQEDDESAGRSGFVDNLLHSAERTSCECGIGRFESFAETGSELRIRERRSNDEIDRAEVLRLPDGNVEFVTGLFLESEMVDVADDADNLTVGIVGVDDLADGVFSREQKAGQRLVEDNYFFRVHVVALGEVAASPKRNAHGFEIAVTDDADVPVRIFLPLINLTFAANAPTAVMAERNGVGEPGGFDS